MKRLVQSSLRLVPFALLILGRPVAAYAQPSITVHPRSTTASEGAAVSFTVAATSSSPITYQWRFRGEDIPAGTDAAYRLANVSLENLGSYSVLVGDADGVVESQSATLSLYVTFSPSFDPGLGIRTVEEGISLFWGGEGRVETAQDPNGPWTASVGVQKNAFAMPLDSKPAFYRLQNPHPRTVRLFVPSVYRPGASLPFLMSLHRYGGDGSGAESFTPIRSLAEAKGFLYCHPDGVVDNSGRGFWNASAACCDFDRKEINDVSFLREIIRHVVSAYGADVKRVHLSGHSNGAFMAFRMAAEHPDLVASIAAIAGTMDEQAPLPSPGGAVSILQIHGTADEVVFYGGGRLGNGLPFTGTYASAENVIDRWAQWNGCGELQVDQQPSLDLEGALTGLDTVVSRAPCPEGVTVEHWAILGAKHFPSWSSSFTAAMVEWLLAHPKVDRALNAVTN
jgi:polyhydroxybutyrate depolymerase